MTFVATFLSLSSVSVQAGSYGSTSFPGSVDLELNLNGHISPRCEIKLSTSQIKIVLFDHPGQAKLDFKVNCNQELNVYFSSRNGGLLLKKSKALKPNPQFTDFLPYDLEFAVNAQGARTVSVNSEEIRATPKGGSIGTVPYEAKGKLSIKWVPEKHLYGGRYGDVIEIRVSGY